MRANILQQARDLAREEGWSSVSIRNIGKRIRYSAPLIYSYFENKEAILLEMQRQGFEQLYDQLGRIREQETDPRQTLVRMSLVHFDFAFDNPDLYQAMFNLEGVACPKCERADIECRQRKFMQEALEAVNARGLPYKPLLFNWWALVHGYIAMQMSNRFQQPQDDMRHLLQEAVERWIDGLR